MKRLFVVVFFLFCSGSLAHAMPDVGDNAIYTYGDVKTLTEKLISNYSEISDKYEIKNFLWTGGLKQNGPVLYEKASELISSNQLKDILTNCKAKGGVPELITVPAGNFKACAISIPVHSNGDIQTDWYADVTFGIAKSIIYSKKDGTQFQMALVRHTHL